MKVTVLCVGGVKGPLAPAVEEYERRASRYWKLRVMEVEAGGAKGGKETAREVMRAEASRILARLPGSGERVALTRAGRPMSSRKLAEFLQDRAIRSTPEVTYIVGGAYGLAGEVLREADTEMALSALTLPHELARLVLAEQLYRAGTMIRNEPYHKGP